MANAQVSPQKMWDTICQEAKAMAESEPFMAAFVEDTIIRQPDLVTAVAGRLAQKLSDSNMSDVAIFNEINRVYTDESSIAEIICADILAVYERDPACRSYLAPVLFFKGFLAVQTYRAAHILLRQGARGTALFLQNRASEVFGADIHPAAEIGRGLMIDHATGVVIGETAIIGNNVSMLHGVTLGGSGKQEGNRHPEIGDGVLISVGAKVLGNIRIGECAKVGGGSVVLADVPAHSTVVGVPAKIVGKVSTPVPAQDMDHSFEEDIS